MILASFSAALGQIGDRRFTRVVVFGLGLAILLLIGLYVLGLLAIGWLTPDTISLPWIGEVGGLHLILGWASLGAILLASIFLMQPVALAFGGLFLDGVADAVEEKHYHWLPPAQPLGLMEGFVETVNLIGLMILINVVLLFLSPFLGPFAIAAFYLANGYLLGREYFTMVARRRMSKQAAVRMRRRNIARIWAAGVLMSIPLTIPLINLLIPVLGTATFTHLFHRLAADQQA